MKKIFFAVVFIASALQLSAQTYNVPEFGNQKVVNGYAKELSGEVFAYHSIHSDIITHSLLTRCTTGNKRIEWLTDKIHFNDTDKYVYVVWVFAHSTGTNGGERNFHFYINGDIKMVITTQQKFYPAYQIFRSENDSTALLLDYKMKDIHGDLHGYAILRLPTSTIKNNEPLNLKLMGEAQNSNDWMMTYQFPFQDKIWVKAFPFLLKNKNKQIINFKTFLTEKDKNISIQIEDKNFEKTFNDIYADFNITIPKVKQERVLHIIAKTNNTVLMDTFLRVFPVQNREIYLVPHSHNDIGYSHLQEEVERIQNQNIINALRQIKLTEKSKAPFKWNIESAWAVENFLKIGTSQQRHDFFEAVRKNQIGLSAFYANELTGLMSQDELNWTVDYAAKLKTNFHLPIKSAMQSDIPGMSWGIVSALAKHGIKYVSHAPNYMEQFNDAGDRIGATLSAQADKMFWWKSVNGKDSVLFWTCGKGYSSWHGFKAGDINERGQEKIGNYMDELQRIKYPYSIVQWRYNIGSDNGSIDSSLSTFVEKWNKMYASPKLKISTTNDVFENFEKKYGKKIPVKTGDFTGYWEDGAYSSAAEEGDARMCSRKISAIENYAKNHQQKLDEQLLYRAKRSIVMWHEHTWGAWCSISAPDDSFTTKQWNYKKRFVDSAIIYTDLLAKSINKQKLIAEKNTTAISKEILEKYFSENTNENLFTVKLVDGLNPEDWADANSNAASKFLENFKTEKSYNAQNKILHYTISFLKKNNADKESMHIEMPFNISKPHYKISVDSGFYVPCQSQINGANKDFFAAQNWIDISNENIGATIFCPQANLYELDKIENEKRTNNGAKEWTNECPQTSKLFLYALNNYWHTNYKASQSGKMQFDIYVQFHDAFDLKKANEFVQKIIEEEIVNK